MRQVNWSCWLVCLCAVGSAGFFDSNPAFAQHQAQAANGKKRQARGRLHPYHESLTNAQKNDTPFQNPKEVTLDPGKGKDTLELTIGKKRFTNRNAKDVTPQGVPAMPYVFELLSYNGQPVGPTLRVQRGTTFKIKVKNAVHDAPDPGSDPQDNPIPGVAGTAENVHGLCTTNLHTHGLHVSPSGKSDNIFRQIEPGKEFTFEYTLPGDHPAGTFWYHPHKHGSTGYQLSNGLSGALIVEGTGPNDLDQIPEIQATRAREKVLVLQSYTFGTYFDLVRDMLVGFIDGVSIYNANEKALVSCDAIQPDPNTLQRGAQGSPWTALAVNGQLDPTMEIQPGELQRWRVVHGGWDAPRTFGWYQDDGAGGVKPVTDFQVYEIALDGLTTGLLDKKIDSGNNPTSAFSTWNIAPGQRSDVLIQAPGADPGPNGTIYYLMVAPDPRDTTNPPPVHVAKVLVKGDKLTMDLPKVADLKRCSYNETYQPGNLVDGTIKTFSGAPTVTGSTNTLSMYSSDATHTYTLNGRSFHSLVPTPIPLQLGTEQKWILRVDENSDSGHPFHIHVNPFRVLSVTVPPGQTAPVTNSGTWRDTLFIDIGWTYEIQSLYKKDKDKDIGGLSVLHCHILDHEDQGMMWPIYLSNDPPAAAGATTPAAKSVLKPASRQSPAIKLTDVTGKPRELAEFRGRKLALVFLRGIQCLHCAEQLRDLIRDARGKVGPDAEIVAISSKPIKDPAKALTMLGVNALDRFHLLVDEPNTVFRAYRCMTSEPQHGLFLIDDTGIIRWSYVGETPFADTQLVVERLRDLATLARDQSRGSQPLGSAARDANGE